MTPSVDWIAHHALTRPDKVATVDLASGRTFTYAEMDDRTSRLASALAETFDVGPGDRIAVLANNNSNFFEVQFACWKLAAIFVPLNWRLAQAELEFIAGDCTPTVMIVDDDFLESGVALANSTRGRSSITARRTSPSSRSRVRWSSSTNSPTTPPARCSSANSGSPTSADSGVLSMDR